MATEGCGDMNGGGGGEMGVCLVVQELRKEQYYQDRIVNSTSQRHC